MGVPAPVVLLQLLFVLLLACCGAHLHDQLE
jgi:hypothetical protein